MVGPARVFTVNAKNLSGKVWVGSRTLLHNGHQDELLPKAVAEAKRAASLLSSAVGRSVYVRPTLAILADEWTIRRLRTCWSHPITG